MQVGYTFLPAAPGAHLWFVCTNPDATGKVATVSLVSLKDWSDRTCIVTPPDHPYVTHESVIYYQDACLREVAALEAALQNGLLQPQQVATDALMQRIRAGAVASRFVPRNVRAAIQNCSWQPAAEVGPAPAAEALPGPQDEGQVG
jgi:hypothetical protein